ncbi:hypothetical protein IMSAGC017_00717 [Thomasclavelia cocleata]|uniref:Uncharacterized protein n=1 Tax=Thomasclavelia cocleata TaxID=69824 RepID=A0A829Z9N1_9FIRM|nr:hypothetical protein [Thomasclavelia cocleata]GFI40682.1 hypothetical protein IMSAGC017_00717 [Thomasclavelia cocleata]
MCKSMEDMRNEAILRERRKIAAAMIEAGRYALEELCALCGLSLEEVQLLQVKVV